MSKKKRFSSAIVAVLLVALMSPFAFRAGLTETLGFASGSFSSFSSFITFFNARDDQAALYVEKDVTNPDPNNTAPSDEEFEFILYKVTDGVKEIVPGMDYTLSDEQGRIYVYESGQTHQEDKTQFELRLATDEHGVFTMKAGQTVLFNGITPGDNYVIEEAQRPDYDIIEPAEGVESVTVKPDGSVAEFNNMYMAAKTGSLVIRKNVSYPSGYEIPDTPEFTFAVKIAGKAYANKDYTVKSISTEKKISEGTTDENGHLKLEGDQYATFEGVPADADYIVTEVLGEGAEDDGWRVSGDTSQSGATQESQGTVLNFTNVLASFAVSKEMFGGVDVDDAFQFQVLDGKSKPWEGSLSYYLYDRTGKLLSDETLKTAEDGTFTLKCGQKAVFIGLEKDTEYGVRELDSGSYVQYIPTTEAGYTNKVVMDSVEELPFVNASVPSKTLLTVKKIINDGTEDGNAPDANFTFVIEKLNDNNEFEPVPKAAYDIINGTQTRTLEADEKGVFTLKSWETARFVELPAGETYRVTELTDEMPNGYVIGGSDYDQGVLGEETLAMTFTNQYKGEEDPYVSIIKENTKEEPLAGAQLQLISKDGDDETIVHEWVSKETAEEFQVKPGTYYIREISAPTGYEVAEDVEITVKKSETSAPQSFTMVDKRDSSIPTGVSTPLVRIMLVLLVLLAAFGVYYRGFYLKRRHA